VAGLRAGHAPLAEARVHNEPDLTSEAPPATGAPHPLQTPANVVAAVGTVWIFVLMLLVVADVLGRNFLDRPITGVAEFAARSVASIVFLQLAAAICAGRMTRSDFLLQIIGKRAPGAVRALDVVNLVVGALLLLALAVIAWPELAQSYTTAEYLGVQGVFTAPAWPFRALIVLGSAFAALAYLLCIPGALRQPQGAAR
jgi:TRAP-type mannitol/chloroaromatic compound transport system permease small subunit